MEAETADDSLPGTLFRQSECMQQEAIISSSEYFLSFVKPSNNFSALLTTDGYMLCVNIGPVCCYV
jgi:hypothetical protein